MTNKSLLRFTQGNAKLDKAISTFSLPAGHSCPGANLCHSKTVPMKKNPCGYGVQDGPNCQFRCFAATDEAKYPNVRLARWHNFNILKQAKTVQKMTVLILASLPDSKFNLPVRLHVAGDFFSQDYFDAWIEVAKQRPGSTFYAYTKSIPFWIARLNCMPHNFKLVASLGGKWDHLVTLHGLKCAKVVYTVAEAHRLGLEIDHDDSHAYGNSGNFALLLHGTQPKGTTAAEAWKALKRAGIGGYRFQKDARAALSVVNKGRVVPLPVGSMLIAA